MKSKYYSLWLLLVTATYFLAGKLGLSLAYIHNNVSPVWPPTGLAIAAVWWLGFRIWPAILLGAFLVNLTTGVSIATAGGIAAGNALEAVSAVYLLHRFVGLRNPFYRARDIVMFLLISSGISTTLAATIGNLSLCLSGAASWSNFGPLWLTWWLGDAVGALVVSPFLLTWLDRPNQRWTLRQVAEGLLLLASLTVASAIVFEGLLFPKLAGYPLEHLMVPFLLWTAFRFGTTGVATTMPLLSGIAVWGTTRGFGPFGTHNPNESLLLLQVFVATAGITTLILAAIVTERKRTAEDLRIKETQLQLITDITPVLLTQCSSSDLRYRFVNRAYATIFGLTPEAIVGKTVPEFIGEAAYETVRPYLQKVLEGNPVEYEGEIPYQQAGNRYMRVVYMPDRDARGKVIGWVASLTDITDRKRAEEQIKKLNSELQRKIEEFQALIDTAPVGIGVAMDPECNYIWGNPEFVNMLGTDQANLSKTGPSRDKLSFKMLRNGKEIPAHDLPMQRACREGRGVLDEELEVIRSDGKTIYELGNATPLLDEQGRVRGCIGVFLNITERKQAEKEREQLLSREQYARAEAEDASRVKDEFLAVVSHELRTPLNSILGWAQLLRSGRLDTSTATRAQESIERNAKAQAKLIDDLLDVSRIISGKLQLDVKSIELISVIHAAIDSLRHALDAKEILLETILEPAANHVQGDATRLQQVVWNLLSNSVKFTSKGGRIEIRLERKNTSAQLTVTDSGEGIRPEFLPYVFDRFRQEDSSRTRKHGGLGLGLSIVQHLIEMHGGAVEARSAGEGYGATFTVTLPLTRQTVDLETLQNRPQNANTQSTLAGMQLVIVEDDPDSLEMLRMVVRLHGANVRTATTTAEALEMLQQQLPDVLVADIGLPDEDGYTLIRRTKMLANEKNKHVRTIALTGYAGEQEGKRALASGFQLYLSKPTEPRRLVEAIAALVRHEKSAVPRSD
jgi:PAS domain S-box-containing protein